MSIKAVLSFRGAFVGVLTVIVFGIAALAFSDRSYLAIATGLFSVEAAEQTTDGPPSSERELDREGKQTRSTTSPRVMGLGSERVFFGVGDLPVLGYPDRRDRIRRLDPTTGTTADLTTINDFEPSVSPDGKKVVFISLRDGPQVSNYYTQQQYREIYTMNVDGTNQRRLGGTWLGGESQPVYSPDQTKILYVADYAPGGQQNGIYTMDTSGGNQTRINTDACFEEELSGLSKKPKRRQDLFPGVFGYDTPNYSPNGAQIIFGYPGSNGINVYKMNADGSNCSVLYESQGSDTATQAQYSPDGTKIALYHEEYIINGGQEAGGFLTRLLRIIDSTTGAIIDDYEPADFQGYPVWNEDGTKILYISNGIDPGSGDEVPNLGISMVDVNTEVVDQLYLQGVPEGIRGIDIETPSTVVPPLRLSINEPNPVTAGQSTTGTVFLASPAVGNTTVNLSVTDAPAGIITLPQSSVTIPDGQSSGIFNVDTPIRTDHRSAGVFASFGPNSAIATVSVSPSRPDLRAVSLTAPAAAIVGVSFNVGWTVENIGPVTTTTSYTDAIYFSSDSNLDASDVQLRTNSRPALAAGASQSISNQSVLIPGSAVPESGQYYLILRTNLNDTVNEGGATGNNTVATPIQVSLADLVVENLSVPANTEPNVSYTMTFDVRNAGGAAAATSFSTRIFVSNDTVFGNGDDAQLSSFSIASLAAGAISPQSRNITIPTLPERPSGTLYFFVQTDATNTIYEGVATSTGETNNTASQATTFDYRVPDLQVTTSSAAADVDTDTAFPLSWTTANAGNKSTTANFVDRVYLSTDQTVGGDTTLGSFTLTGGLAAGATADRIQNITINYANVPASGNYYLLIQTDQSGLVNEGANEGNNVRVQPIYVRKALRPDLVVSNVTGPPTVFFDQTIQVQWTVTNNGTGPTNAPQWKDRLYIGTSPTTTSGASLLVEANSITALNPGESYTTAATVKIPRGISGGYHFLVRANSNGAVNEVSTTNNLLSSPVQVNVPPLPDLIVETVQAPDEVFAGTPIAINYSIRNIGTEDAGSRKDRIYLSRDTTLNTSQDKLIFTSDSLYGPAAGQATSHVSHNRIGTQNPPVYQQAIVPSNLEGLWYVFVVADYQNAVYEYTAENNNTGYDTAEPGSPMNILVTPPDLVVPNQPTAPATVATGQSFQVDFTVRNQGAFNAGANLYHAVYLSTDQTFDAGSDTLIGTFKDTNFFSPGAEHPITINTSLQSCLANGTYYLFAVADYDNRQFEYDPGFDAEANNASPFRELQVFTVPPDLQITSLSHTPVTLPGQSVTVNWSVANTGGNAAGNWTDRIQLVSMTPGISTVTLASVQHSGGLVGGGSYSGSRVVSLPTYMQGDYYITVMADAGTTVPECGTSESNNAAQGGNFSVTNNLPDLVIDSVTAPTSATVGDSFLVQWTGRNANEGMPSNSPSWRDYVYLSSDTNLSSGDINLGSALNSTILGPGQTYPQQTTVNIGNVAPGTYYLLVYGDGSSNIYEGSSASGFESNNVRASAAITLTAPAVDLTVAGVSVSTPHYSGTYRTVSWTVTNVGTSPTLATSWTDYIYLSRDSILDPADTQLGYLGHTGTLAGGASYSPSHNVFIPVGLTGDYSVLVVTDKNNGVVESSNSNNISPPLAINLTVPPPAELNITNITPPATVALGGSATFTWTVQNTGLNPVEGLWRDTVYLSRDQFWDATDTLVGVRDLNSQTTSVPASGGTYSTGYSGQVPPVDEGTYYVIVRTDAQNRIRESNEANNVLTSVGTTTVTITTLTLNTPLNTTLGNGASLFFKYLTDPAETLVFSLDTNIQSRSNEALTNFGTIVSRADYDFQSSRPGEGDQENVIDPTQEGNYYTMVRTDLIPESFAANFNKEPAKTTTQNGSLSVQNITVQAKILPFSIRKVSPEEAGNAGKATIVVEGAKFQPGATMKLVRSGSPDVVPVKQRTKGNMVIGIFDLVGKTAGEYDVVVTNPDSQTATLADGFEIISGGGAAEPRVTLRGPGSSRGGRVRYTISVSNDGLNDLFMVPFFIVVPSNYAYELDQSNFITDFSDVLEPDAVPSQIPVHFDKDGLRLIPLTTPVLGSKRTVKVNIDLLLPFGFGEIEVAAFALPPLEEWSNLARSAQEEFLNRQAANMTSPEKCEGKWNACMAEALRGIFFTLLAELLPGGCAGEGWKALLGISDYVIGIVVKGSDANLWDAVGGTGNMLLGSLGGIAEECFLEQIPWYKAAAASVAIFKLLMDFYQCYQQYIECMAPPPEKIRTTFPMSRDPNEKIGPIGYGGEKWVPVGQPLEYRINFENLSSATAPAQLVRITDSLPPPLDLRTVRLKEIGFKQNRYVIPANQSFYQARVQLGEDLGNLQADILAGVDLLNNRVFWNLQSIDPNTGEAPLDPFAGLLPPNNANKDGEGYVTFTVEAKSTFPNQTMISNSASIIFDQNEPIVTNATENLLDSVVPTSEIAALPATSESPEVPLTWSGTDDTNGSGFKGHSIVYSEDGGGYLQWLNSPSDTSTAFVGRWGKTYRFYSIGRDNAGNVELAPAQPDASIRILGGDTEGDVSPRPNGSDGTLDGDDVTQVRRFIARLDSAMQYNEYQRADMAPRAEGGNGALTVADVMQARRYIAGTDARAEASGPNQSSGFAPNTVAGKSAAMLPREIKAETIARFQNQVIVGIKLEAQGDETGLGFGLNFDPAVLSNPVVSLGNDAAGSILTVNSAEAGAGKLGILLDRAPNAPIAAGSKMVVRIVFDIAAGAPPSTQLTFGNDPVASEVVNGLADALTTTFSSSTISLISPTSAGVSVSGSVKNLSGLPIRNARLTITDPNGVGHTAITNAFGHFRFEDVASGQNYTITVIAKGYVFTPRLITVTDEISGLEILAQP